MTKEQQVAEETTRYIHARLKAQRDRQEWLAHISKDTLLRYCAANGIIVTDDMPRETLATLYAEKVTADDMHATTQRLEELGVCVEWVASISQQYEELL